MKRADNKIGHFTSKKGKEDFQITYDESMALLPNLNDTKDIKTKYGTIRAYYSTKQTYGTNTLTPWTWCIYSNVGTQFRKAKGEKVCLQDRFTR